MLSVYTRHSQKCPHRDDIAWRRCRCPKWIQGTPSEDHEFLRTSAQTRTWEQAEAKARQLEEAARPGARKPAPAISITEAVAAYRADEAGRCLAKSTTNQSKTLFQVHLLAWAKDVGLTLLRELTTPNLVMFRATWGNGPNTTRRKHERLIGFFEFCISNPNVSQRGRAAAKSSSSRATEAGQDPEIIVWTFIGGLAGGPRPGGSDFWSEKDTPFPPTRCAAQLVWLLPPSQQRRAATCNCRCTWRNSSR